jgi:hypothetical protein
MTPEKAARHRRPSQAELATQAAQTTGDIGRRVELGVSLAEPSTGTLQMQGHARIGASRIPGPVKIP